ncbi:hypothetical protein H0H87_005296 [Tephrocybe sp. NHM501043]|nr:hypothetical protein H0H87_005296 [Tephrocybe sp. NHM501043]
MSHFTNIILLLTSIFASKEHYRRLVNCEPSDAQKLLDSFQRLLDEPILDLAFRRNLIVAMQRLSVKSGLYPTCHELKDVTPIGDYPVAAGGFADIYKGHFQERVVCLKVIRLYEKSQIQHMLKAEDVAKGLSYLHNEGVIHGDLKGPNVLIDGTGRARLADFGLSVVSDPDIIAWTTQSKTTSQGGSVRWQAPELFVVEDSDVESEEETVKNTMASDVYAWGCVCLEVFTGQIPFSETTNNVAVIHRVHAGAHPRRPLASQPCWKNWGLTEEIWSLMKRCWDKDPTQRPSASAIAEHFASTLNQDSRLGPDTDWISHAVFRSHMSNPLEMIDPDDLHRIVYQWTLGLPDASAISMQPSSSGSVQLPPPLEKSRFDDAYKRFCMTKGVMHDPRTINFEGRDIDIYQLHTHVMQEGGQAKVCVDHYDAWWHANPMEGNNTGPLGRYRYQNGLCSLSGKRWRASEGRT